MLSVAFRTMQVVNLGTFERAALRRARPKEAESALATINVVEGKLEVLVTVQHVVGGIRPSGFQSELLATYGR